MSMRYGSLTCTVKSRTYFPLSASIALIFEILSSLNPSAPCKSSALLSISYYTGRISSHREDKLRMLQSIVDQFLLYEERRAELDAKIAELNQLVLDHEVGCQMEEPAVQQLDAEVKELRQTIKNYSKQKVSLKTVAKSLKEKTDAINEKISKADFELKNAQENSKLSKIVYKLQFHNITMHPSLVNQPFQVQLASPPALQPNMVIPDSLRTLSDYINNERYFGIDIRDSLYVVAVRG